MSRGSKARRKAIAWDVDSRAWYAFSRGISGNPYDPHDKRHDLFDTKMRAIESADRDFEGMCKAHNFDTSTLTRRLHPDPGPVVPIEQLELL